MKPLNKNMIRSVMLLAVISVISLTIAHSNAQAQQQASTGQNNTAAELARDPGDLFLKDKATPSQELKRDPGDLLLNITADELARDPGDLLSKDKATPSQELKKDPGDLILTGPK
ncbi:MAG: hypothetical protein M3044_17445 [Thermoproteota archaeon]|jgi:hypothetical protein|nr:hypothetical protein [Thermoproteota archaeon]